MNFKSLSISLVCVLGGVAAGGLLRRHSGGEDVMAGKEGGNPEPASAGAVPIVPDGNLKPGASGMSGWERVRAMLRSTGSGGLSALSKAWRESARDPLVREWLVEVWTKDNPEALLQVMCQETPEDYDANIYLEENRMKKLVRMLADRDPAKIMRLARGVEQSRMRVTVKGWAVASVMEKNVKEGLRMAVSDREAACFAGAGYLEGLVGPEELSLIDSLPDSKKRSELREKALEGLPVEQAMERAAGYSGLDQNVTQSATARRWVEEDRAGALEYLKTSATPSQRPHFQMAVGERLLAEDPQAAADWAQQNLSGQNRNQILKQVADKLDKTDPAAAEAIRTLTPKGYARPPSP